MGTPASSKLPRGAVPGRCGLNGGNGWYVACDWGCEVGAEPLAAAAPKGSGGGFMDESWEARREDGCEVEAGGVWWLLPFEGAGAEGWVAVAVAWGRRGEGGTEFKSGAMAGLWWAAECLQQVWEVED